MFFQKWVTPFSALITELKCPTEANTTGCIASNASAELYTGWDAIDDDNDSGTATVAPWYFGNDTQLPALDL